MSEIEKKAVTKPKKGKVTWKQGSLLDVENKNPGFRFRWVSKDPQNIAKKQSEGWAFANKETGVTGEHIRPTGVEDGKSLSTATEYRDVVLMALPEELGEARDEYFQEKTKRQLSGAKDNLRDAALRTGGKYGRSLAAGVHGSITTGTTVID